jgi:HSP20 family protein
MLMFVVRRRGGRSIERIQYEMEDTFNSMLGAGMPVRVRVIHGAVPTWRPPIEVYETSDALVVMAELAGLTEDQIEVTVDDSVLTIRGERSPVGCDERRTIHTMGIAYGPFAADVYIPFAVDHESINASYESGILRVRLPRAAATRVEIGNDLARSDI